MADLEFTGSDGLDPDVVYEALRMISLGIHY